MDVLVRFWSSAENRVSTHYVNSVFMGKATASDVLENFEAVSEGLNKNKFIQVSSDDPNVNLKFLELLAEKCKDDSLNELIPIGTCRLHMVNGAFQNLSPSRRVDYERILSATKDYPLFFCSTCWVENANVAKKAKKIWLKLVAVVKYWSALPKNKQPG